MKSDLQLQEDVNAQLNWAPDVEASRIGVTARGGVVTLSGQVPHFVEKAAAEAAAKSVYGVRGIANDIAVQVTGDAMRTDQDVAAAVLAALDWNSHVPKEQINVVVTQGWVTLEGNVDWQYQKDAAGRCVTGMMAVTGVTNSIVIKPVALWTDVTGKIEEAFRRSADLQAHKVNVQAVDGAVTLSGTVSSWSERDEADAAAWAAPGVISVKNNLAILA